MWWGRTRSIGNQAPVWQHLDLKCDLFICLFNTSDPHILGYVDATLAGRKEICYSCSTDSSDTGFKLIWSVDLELILMMVYLQIVGKYQFNWERDKTHVTSHLEKR